MTRTFVIQAGLELNVAQANLENLIHLPPLLRFWDCRYRPPCLELSPCMLGKHSQMNYMPSLTVVLFYAVLYCLGKGLIV